MGLSVKERLEEKLKIQTAELLSLTPGSKAGREQLEKVKRTAHRLEHFEERQLEIRIMGLFHLLGFFKLAKDDKDIDPRFRLLLRDDIADIQQEVMDSKSEYLFDLYTHLQEDLFLFMEQQYEKQI